MASKKTVTKYVAVDEDLWEAFSRIYPSHGGLSWFVNACIEQFTALHTTPIDEEIEEVVKSIALQ